MNPQRLAVLLLLGLAGCGAGEKEPLAYTPDPVPPGLWERAEAGDAAAQFELAEHLWPAHPGDPAPLYWGSVQDTCKKLSLDHINLIKKVFYKCLSNS